MKLLLEYKEQLHDTTTAVAYGKLGVSYIQMAKYDSAFATFQKGVDISFNYPSVKAKLPNSGSHEIFIRFDFHNAYDIIMSPRFF